MTGSPLEWCCATTARRWCWIALAMLGVAAAATRIVMRYNAPGVRDPVNQGYCDFHNGVYFPSLAFTHRVSPYSQHYADTYPVARQLPPYSPLIIALHTPLTLLPLQAAEVVYFFVMIGCVAAIAWLLVREHPSLPGWCVWPIIAAIVWTRPGHVTIYNGYFTFELVLGTLVALSMARTRPWVAALGIAVASGKPTYFLPLVALMAARGDLAAVWRGCLLSIVGGLLSMLWLTGPSSEALRDFLTDLQGGQAVHMSEPLESPVVNWTRVDLAAVGAKITGNEPSEVTQLTAMLLILALPMVVLWSRRNPTTGAATDPTGALIIAASLCAIYHHTYDGLLLMAPLVGLLGARWRRNRCWPPIDIAIGLLLAVPLVNLSSTGAFLNAVSIDPVLHRILTSVNGVAITAAMLLLSWRIAVPDRLTQPPSPT